MENDNLCEVMILKEYYNEIEKIVAQSAEFQTVADYVNFVLREMLSAEGTPGYSEEEEEMVQKRLRDLGYM